MFAKVQTFRMASAVGRLFWKSMVVKANNAPLGVITPSQYRLGCIHFSNMPVSNIATFDEVKAAKDNKNLIIIDVREPTELKETGVLPNSINVPLGDLEKALNMPQDDFKTLYGHSKPDNNFHIIFSCKLGKRSEMARQLAIKLGYSNVQNYSGGWQEWEQKIKQ